MFKRNPETRTVTIHDTDIKNPFNANDFVKWMNQVVYLVDIDYEGPANAYANALINEPKRYNTYNELVFAMSEQFTYLCGKLKQSGLPVVMPDYKSFLERYEVIKSYDSQAYARAIQEEVKALEISFMTSIQQNIQTAQLNNIPLKKPEPKKTK